MNPSWILILICTSIFSVQCSCKRISDEIADNLKFLIQQAQQSRPNDKNIAREVEALPQFLDILSTSAEFSGTSYPLILNQYSPGNSTYDYIVIGSGTAGSVVAGRLTENSPRTRVLVLEAGGPENDFIDVPFNHLFLQKTSTDWQYQGVPQKRCAFGLKDRGIPVSRAKLIGGCSSHNAMVYSRGDPKDYDRWAALGAQGWSWPEVFPYFVKSESVDPDPGRFDPGYHGTRGPVTVTAFREPSTLESAILRAAAQTGKEVGDYNGANSIRWSYTQYMINKGERVSMARAYPARAQARGFNNLDILARAFVERILFDGNRRAIGVEFTQNGKKCQAFASNEIIVSAGSINSPQLLMLSGIGPRKHLESLGISVLVDSPGVGSNLQDHPMTIVPFTASQGDGFVYTRKHQIHEGIRDYKSNRSGLFASPGANLIGFIRTSWAADSRPDFEFSIGGSNPGGALPARLSGHIYNLKSEIIDEYFMPNILQDGFIILPFLLHPRSRGTIRLASSDPYKHPLIDHNLYSDDRDMKAMVDALRLVFNLTIAPALQDIDARPYRGKLGDCDRFPLYTDAYLDCYARTFTICDFHPVGTVRMGAPDDLMAPLDPQLRVKGVKGLRVIDGSVMPEIVGGNTNAPIMMIAEKAVDMIKGRSLKPLLPPFHDEDQLLSYS